MRIAVAFVVCHLVGRAYRDQALSWFTRFLGVKPAQLDQMNAGFSKAELFLVPFFAGSNIVAVLTGVHRTAPARLVVLLTIGIAGRLVLFWYLAHAFEEPLEDIVGWLQRYQWWFIIGSIVVVVLVNVRNFRRGAGSLTVRAMIRPMAEITLRGNPIHTVGELPAVGSPAPAFTLTGSDLADVTLGDFAGKTLVLNIFPSLDTGVCAASVRAFNEKAGGRDDVNVLNVSADLPFAQGRFCGAEGIEGVSNASSSAAATSAPPTASRSPTARWPACCRGPSSSIDADGNVAYTEQVPEIAQEPDYDAALAAL